MLRATDPDLDFWNASSNHVEHRGSIAACFNAKDLVDLVTGVHLSSPLDLQDMVIVGTVESAAANAALVMPSCGTPNVTMAGKVQASEAGSETTLGSGLLILDDPATSQIVEDYWLHPCQCVPPDWDGAPVTPDAIADIPSRQQQPVSGSTLRDCFRCVCLRTRVLVADSSYRKRSFW